MDVYDMYMKYVLMYFSRSWNFYGWLCCQITLHKLLCFIPLIIKPDLVLFLNRSLSLQSKILVYGVLFIDFSIDTGICEYLGKVHVFASHILCGIHGKNVQGNRIFLLSFDWKCTFCQWLMKKSDISIHASVKCQHLTRRLF